MEPGRVEHPSIDVYAAAAAASCLQQCALP
jgi:hypothetical protein